MTRKLPPFANGDPRLRFVFTVEVARRDRELLEGLCQALDCGSIRDVDPRKALWQPTSVFTVSSVLAHRRRVIPFMQRYLLPGARRDQFDLWCAALAAYEIEHPSRWGNGPSPCKVSGCGRPVRGRGLCRSHYYRETGH